MMRPMTVRRVLERLAPEVVLTAESEGAVRDALRQLRTGSPWYLRVLMAIGAWIGTSFLLSFVVGLFALILDGEIEGAMLLFGLVLMGGAVALRRQVENDFLHQLALVVSFTGQGMFIGGVGATTEAIEPAALAGLMVSGVLIAVFPDRVHRFLSTGLAVAGLTTLMVTAKIAGGSQVVAIGLMALRWGCGAAPSSGAPRTTNWLHRAGGRDRLVVRVAPPLDVCRLHRVEPTSCLARAGRPGPRRPRSSGCCGWCTR